VASLSQGRTAAAQCGLFTYKSVPVIFEPPCIYSQRHENLKHVTGVQACSSEFCFTSNSIFSIEAQYGTSAVLRGL